MSLGVVLGGSAFAFWVAKKPAASFERSDNSQKTLLSKNGVSQDGENVTDKAAQGLLSEYLSTQAGRDSISKEEQDRLTQDLAEKVRQENLRADPYVIGDLNLVEDSNEAYRAYGNALGAIFFRYENIHKESEVAVMRTAFATKNATELSKILDHSTTYQDLSKDLSKVSVPRSLADIHLRFLNGYASISSALRDISVVFEDSLRGMIGIKSYEESLTEVVTATEDLRAFFSKNTVTFKETEPGFPFVRVRP